MNGTGGGGGGQGYDSCTRGSSGGSGIVLVMCYYAPPPSPPSPPSPPPLPSARDGGCSRLTSRWFLNSSTGSFSFADTVGTWNATTTGSGLSFSNAYQRGALSFDGVSGGIVLLGSYTFGGALSVAFWAMDLDAVTGNNRAVFDFSGSAAGSNAWLAFALNGGGGRPFINVGYTSPNYFNFGSLPPVGAWVHYAFTMDSSGRATIYINGTQIANNTFAGGALPVVSRTLTLGNCNGGNGCPFFGALSDFQLSVGYVFTAGDVLNLYNGVGCPAPPPPPSPPPTSSCCFRGVCRAVFYQQPIVPIVHVCYGCGLCLVR